MKNFIKQNWFKIIIAVAVLIVAVSAGYYFIINSPKPKQITNNDSDLLNQQKCATQADKIFKENGYDSSKYTDFYTDHWNKSFEKCFLFITSIRTENGGITSKFLTDAYESTIYGQFFQTDYAANLNGPPDCEMYKDGKRDSFQGCKSETEFDNFVKPYMEN